MIKIIAFDSWAAGAYHYHQLLDAFTRKGLELTLIHVGSWGDQKGRPAREVIGSLQVRDISFYSGKSFLDILELEKPSAVLFLSTDAFCQRAFNRYCRLANLPTVLLFHGVHGVLDLNTATQLKVNPYKRIWMLRRHLVKALRHHWPAYARSLWETRATVGEWCRFAHDILQRARARTPEQVARDSRTDRLCVYIDSEVEYAIKKYGYPQHDGHSQQHVSAVGNPDLILFGITSDMLGMCLRQACLDGKDRTDVLYIATALAETGAVYDSNDDFVQHVVSTRDELARQGKQLILKPHPSQGKPVLSALADVGIVLCSNKDFVSRLQRCCACITEPSSASLIPALLGAPLFLAEYGKLCGQPFGELLTGYPRARRLQDLRSFSSSLLAAEADVDLGQTTRWIAQHAGPLPAQCMPDRVAEVVISLVRESRTAWTAAS